MKEFNLFPQMKVLGMQFRRQSGAMDRLLRDREAFIKAVTDPYICGGTLDVILNHPEAVELLRQNPEALAQVLGRYPWLRRHIEELE